MRAEGPGTIGRAHLELVRWRHVLDNSPLDMEQETLAIAAKLEDRRGPEHCGARIEAGRQELAARHSFEDTESTGQLRAQPNPGKRGHALLP